VGRLQEGDLAGHVAVLRSEVGGGPARAQDQQQRSGRGRSTGRAGNGLTRSVRIHYLEIGNGQSLLFRQRASQGELWVPAGARTRVRDLDPYSGGEGGPLPTPRTIVLVEDDAEIRALVDTVLSAEGYRVVGTGDPTRAVEIVRNESPDLVVCDIMMPVMDGYAVLRALQSDPTTSRYPVMFLTARQEFNERVRAFRFGVVDYLTKPFTREVLLRKVESVVEGRARRAGFVAGEGRADPASL